MKTLKYLYAEALDEKQRYARETGSKFSTFDQLVKLEQQYRASNNYFLFVQYSSVNKLGINPKSPYDSPLGIYSYPLMTMGIDKFAKGQVPFATEREYIIVFTVSKDIQSKMVVLNSSGDVDDAHSGLKSSQIAQIYQRFNPAGSRKKQTTFDKLWRE